MNEDTLRVLLEREFSAAKEFRDKTGTRLDALEDWTITQDERARSNKRWRNYILSAIGVGCTVLPFVLNCG